MKSNSLLRRLLLLLVLTTMAPLIPAQPQRGVAPAPLAR